MGLSIDSASAGSIIGLMGLIGESGNQLPYGRGNEELRASIDSTIRL
jgi:hypothetical protein